VLPPDVGPTERAGTVGGPNVVDRRQQLLRLGGVDDPEAAVWLERKRVPAPLAKDRDLARPRCNAVAEAGVDALLRSPQRCNRLAALPNVVELRAHHLPQHASAAVRRVDANDCDSGARDLRAGCSHLERERTGAADDRAVVARGVHPLERHAERPRRSLLGGLGAEVLPDPEERILELVLTVARADLKSH
jgi:hypothetical protein